MMRPPAPDEGFTLIELLMSIAITAVITVVIAACIIVGLKTTDATAARLAESHDAQMLSTYLVADVQSASASGVSTASGAGTGCAAAKDEASYTSDSNVLLLTWTQTVPALSNYRASYRLGRNSSTDEWQLRRYACKNGAAATSIVVARQLADPSTNPPVVDVSQAPAISLTLTEPTGYAFTVMGVRRSPAPVVQLPAVPWACTVRSAWARPDPAIRTSAAPGPLRAPLRVKVRSGGDCPSLKLQVDPGGSPPYDMPLVESANGSGDWNATISTGTWTDGNKDFPIVQGSSTVIGTLRMTVKQPCLVKTMRATPNPAPRSSGPAPSSLANDEAISVVTTGPCLALVANATSTPGAPTMSLSLTESPVGSGHWSTTIAADSQNWSDGVHVLRVHEPGGRTLRSTSLVITPNCTVSTPTVIPNPSASPNPVGRGTDNLSNELESDVTVGLTTTGDCSGLRVEFKPDGTTAALVTMTESPPATWTATLSKSDYPWTAGDKVLDINNSDGDLVAAVTLTVN